jgi:hypothetical protein
MKHTVMRSDRRKQKRFKVMEGAFAALVNHNSKLGQIKDISISGLSFCYIDDHNQGDDTRELKIIIGDHGLYMDKVPYKKIADFEIKSEYSFSLIKMRRINLVFGELTREQQHRLDDFIQNHTVGEV